MNEEAAIGDEGFPTEAAGQQEAAEEVDAKECQQDVAQEHLRISYLCDAQDVQNDKKADNNDRRGDDGDAGDEDLQGMGEAHGGERRVEGAGEAVHRADQVGEDAGAVGFAHVAHRAAGDGVGRRQLAVVQRNAVGQDPGKQHSQDRGGAHQAGGVTGQHEDFSADGPGSA